MTMVENPLDTAEEAEPSLKGSLVDLKKKGFFKYMGRSLLVILLVYVLLVLIVFLLGKHLVDFNAFFSSIIRGLSDRFVILLFFASESFTGMIPVDLFVIWTQKFEDPLPWLAMTSGKVKS